MHACMHVMLTPIIVLRFSFSLLDSNLGTWQILHKKSIGQTQAARDGLETNKQKCELCYW